MSADVCVLSMSDGRIIEGNSLIQSKTNDRKLLFEKSNQRVIVYGNIKRVKQNKSNNGFIGYLVGAEGAVLGQVYSKRNNDGSSNYQVNCGELAISLSSTYIEKVHHNHDGEQ
ncbi:hypothetical protein ACIQ1D_18840 [Lysinibacillus xylanilyticus]|uniref:hypothetical protein n=1 Tax=Lysinibacillus xylanilyticus TaxID=582475 RepID=UPI00381906BA